MAPLLLPLGLVGCGSERAVRVEIEEVVRGDRLCVVAHAAGEIQFAAGYDWADLPDGERSLTFVAGGQVNQSLIVTARVMREGDLVGRATSEVPFGAPGVAAAVLRPGRCIAGSGPSGERAGGTFAALGDEVRAIGADLDGDGGDELCVIGDAGTLLALDVEDRDAGSRRATLLDAPMAVLVAAGDLDGDCRLDVIGADPLGALVVIGADGSSPAPIGPAGTADVAVGLAIGGVPLIAIAGGDLSITPWDEDAPETLATGAFTAVEAGDLTGDGRGDLIAVGETGLRAFVGGADALTEEPGVLPGGLASMTGPIALADLDGDGALDLIAAEGTAVRIAINRGDGLLEDRTGDAPALPAGAVRIAVGDLDGDCEGEIAILADDGSITVLTRDARGALVALDRPSGEAVEIAILDPRGDGARELALVRAGGSVTLWRP